MRKIMLVSYWLGWTHLKIVPVEICIDKKMFFLWLPLQLCSRLLYGKTYESLPIICPHQHWGQFYTLTLQLTRVNHLLKIKLNSVLFYTFLFHRCEEWVGRFGGNNLNRSEKYQRITGLCDMSFDNILIVTPLFLWSDCSQFWIIFLGLCVKLCITSSALSL